MSVNVAVEGRSDEGMAAALLRSCGLTPWRIIPADGKTRLDPKIPRNVRAASHEPWVIFRDSDGECPVELRRRLISGAAEPEQFVLRIACTMTEAWLMGDPEAFRRYFHVESDAVPARPEELAHAKRALLNLVHRSRNRAIREEMLDEKNPHGAGVLYVDHLNTFARTEWDPTVAEERCPSLERARRALTELAAHTR